MQPEVVPPSTGDPLIRKTFLSIQLVSKAGWEAATPYIWQTIRFTKDEDYVSFFSSISLFNQYLHESNPGFGRWTYESLLESLIDEDGEHSLPAHLESGLDRFFCALHKWTVQIIIESAPPVSVEYEVENVQETNSLMYGGGEQPLADGVDFFFGGKFCPPQDTGEGELNSKLKLLHNIATVFEPRDITVFDIPTEDSGGTKWFWTVYERLMSACGWLSEPLNVFDLQPGCPLTMAHDATTIHLSSKASWLDPGPNHDFDQEIAKGLALFALKRMTDYDDILFTNSFLHVKGWIGCPSTLR